MTHRTLQLIPFAVLLAVGCGGGKDAPQNPAKITEPDGVTTTVTPTPPTPPAPPADPYNLDPTQHVLPSTPIAGRLGGKTFAPDRVEIEEGRLTLRQGKDLFPDLEMSFQIHPEIGKSLNGMKLVVKPTDKGPMPHVPQVTTSVRTGQQLPEKTEYQNGYALTLELGVKANGMIPGRLVLCLPDAEKSVLAGAFEAVSVRSLNSPPGSDETPFVQGTVAVKDTKGKSLTVGYVAMNGEDSITDRVGSPLPDTADGGFASQSSTFLPRTATLRYEKGTPKYDFAKLPPGKYLVFAKVSDGPVAWAWADVKPDSRLTVDLSPAGAMTGTASVKVPAKFDGEVRLVPADLGGVPDPSFVFAGNVGFALELQAKPKDGTATIANVPPGKYSLFATPGRITPRGMIEVTAGKTAMAELQAEPK